MRYLWITMVIIASVVIGVVLGMLDRRRVAMEWEPASWTGTTPHEQMGTYDDGIRIDPLDELFAADPLGSYLHPPQLDESTPLFDVLQSDLGIDWDFELSLLTLEAVS